VNSHLSSHHRLTIEKIFRHPAGGNIEWRQVVSLLEDLGSVNHEHNGKFTVTLGTETEVFEARGAKTSMSRWSSTCAGCSRRPGGRQMTNKTMTEHHDGLFEQIGHCDEPGVRCVTCGVDADRDRARG